MSPSASAPRPVEVELKYRLLVDAAGDHYLFAEELAGFTAISPVRSTQLEDRYLDTADGGLARAGFAARLRQTAKGTTASVKALTRRSGGGGVHRREELEGPADRTSGPRDWPPSDARSLILEQCGDAPLVEVVTIRQLRRKRKLQSAETIVEVSLDEVDVVARSRVVERFVELEVELVEGHESALDRIEKILREDEGLTPSTASKFEAALKAIQVSTSKRSKRAAAFLALIEPDGEQPLAREASAAPDVPAVADAPEAPRTAPMAAPEPTKSAPDPASKAEEPADSKTTAAAEPVVAIRQTAPSPDTAPPAKDGSGPAPETESDAPRLVVGKTPGVLADDHLAEAGRKVLRFHLARMLAREAGTREGKVPDELHGMRVATRRQRAAWRVFGQAFRPGRTRAHRKRLREVASRLGAVRDLDVLLEAADAYRADLAASEQRAIEPLLRGWRDHRDDARRLLIRELDSEGYRRWIDDYSEFVRHEGLAVAPVAPTEPHRVRDTAASRILAAYEGVRAYEPVLRWADVETLHELRIAGKWLRYTLEFVREALGPEASMLIARVTAIQDHLGLLNDADVTAHMARSFLVENASELSQLESAAIARYLVSREREVARLRRTVGGPWRGVAGVSFRRALGRTIAGL